MERQDILWRSWYHSTIMRHTNASTLMLLIWEVQLGIANFNIFGSNNITLHNLWHHMAFSSPDLPVNITLQPLSGLMLSTKVYLNTSFWIVLHNTLWSVHQINFQPILTTPYPSLTLASIPIPSSCLVPHLQFHFFKSHTNITYVTAHHTRNLYPFHIWCSNAVTTFKTNLYPQQYHLQVHSTTSLRQGKISI